MVFLFQSPRALALYLRPDRISITPQSWHVNTPLRNRWPFLALDRSSGLPLRLSTMPPSYSMSQVWPFRVCLPTYAFPPLRIIICVSFVVFLSPRRLTSSLTRRLALIQKFVTAFSACNYLLDGRPRSLALLFGNVCVFQVATTVILDCWCQRMCCMR